MRLERVGAGVRLRFDPAEAEALVGALDGLLTALDEMGPGHPVWERFYPAAFSDDDAAEEFRDMVGEDLDNERRHRLQACRTEVQAARPVRRSREVTLEPEELERWIAALNDLRLALGTRLGITAEPSRARPGRTGQDVYAQDASAQDAYAQDAHAQDAYAQDAYAQDYAVYHWLTGVQDGLVSATL